MLRKTYELNPAFWWGFIIYLLACGIGLLSIEQGDMVLYFSKTRTEFMNGLFAVFTRLGEALVYVLFAVLFLWVAYRKSIGVLLLGVTVTLVSFITKAIFAHPRPLAYFRELGMEAQLTFVPGVDVHTGATSFPSGHTMSGFALYSFIAFILGKKGGLGLVAVFFATMVGISRVYLVQHFLKDIFLGAILGVLISVVMYYLINSWKREWLDKNLVVGS
ncbi:MAG: phosphatase PAP2 family protein [Bacteroidota bacterium]